MPTLAEALEAQGGSTARAARAAIYWGDETGVSNRDQTGRSYAPKGETPVVVRTAGSERMKSSSCPLRPKPVQ